MAQGSRSSGVRNTSASEQTQTDLASPAVTDPAPTAGDGRVAELEAENARLYAELVAARQQLAAGLAAPAARRQPTEPSFVFSEGQRAELEATGRTVSPFTGARQVGTGQPGEKPRTATADEFAKAKPAAARTV